MTPTVTVSIKFRHSIVQHPVLDMVHSINRTSFVAVVFTPSHKRHKGANVEKSMQALVRPLKQRYLVPTATMAPVTMHAYKDIVPCILVYKTQ